ncbi:MAG: ABC transporter substrate-binding protein [Candidatus Limnocylindria bacterium]
MGGDQMGEAIRGRRLSRRDLIRLTGATAIGVAGANVLAACTPGATPQGTATPTSGTPVPSGPKRLIWGAAATALRLDPMTSSQTVDLQVFDSIYDTLTWRLPNNELVPRAATEWRLANDTTWQFKLRPGIRWHNGDPFTAEDVKYTFERAIDPDGPSIRRASFSLLQGVEVVDDLTVNFVMRSPDPLWPSRLTAQGAWLVPARYHQEVGAEEFERQPVGTGPFKFVEHVRNDHITIEANEDYWDGVPNAEDIRISAIPEASARITALVDTDETNFTDIVPFDLVQRVEQGATTKIVDVRQRGYYTITPNHAVAPLGDPRIRQALSLAIDRPTIVDGLMRGRASIPNGFIPEEDFAYDGSLTPLAYDPQRARDLLREAGYANEEIFIETQRNILLDNEQQVSEAVIAMWKDVGINGVLELLEPAVRAEKNRLRNWKGTFTSYFTSVLADPDGFMWRTLQPNGGLNHSWVNEEFFALGREAGTSFDENLRRRNYERMNQIYRDELPTIALLEATHGFGMKQYIDFTPGPVTSVDFRRDNLQFR